MVRTFLFPAWALAGALLSPMQAGATSVGVTVTTANGQPLAGAIVTIDAPHAARPAPHGPYVMAQHNISFDPHILIVPVGATVQFPNKDQVRHHVYSFSPAKRFEIKLYGRDESKSIRFDTAGVVSLGCNIHDSMSGFIFVTATPFTAMSDAQGHVRFDDVPAGRAVVTVWDPSLRTPGNTLSRPVDVGTAAQQLIMAAR